MRGEIWKTGGLFLAAAIMLIPASGFLLGGPSAARPTPVGGSLHASSATESTAVAAAVSSLSHGAGPAQGHSLSCQGTGTSSSLRCASPTTTASSGPGASKGVPWSCHGLRELGTSACGARATSVPASSNVTGWVNVGPNPPTQEIYDSYLAYDASDGYVLLLGATNGWNGYGGPVSDAWAYAHGNWTEVPASPMPAACPGSVMSYDSADRYVLYLGGSSLPYGAPCPSSNQTWSYHAGVWSRLNVTASPTGLVYASMSDDPADGYVLLFGGETFGPCVRYGYCNSTWEFHGGNWTLHATPHSPSARGEAGMAYDAHDGYVLLFGGLNGSGALNDSWEFLAGNWTQLHPTSSPPVPQPDGFTYDSTDGVIVYTTASNYSGNTSEITWTYSAGQWTSVTGGAAPPQRLGGVMADDPSDSGALFFGGLGGFGGSFPLDDTWVLSSGNWTNLTHAVPSPRWDAAVTYDPSTHSVLLFGGWWYAVSPSLPNYNDTWSYTNGTWTPIVTTSAPSVQGDAGICWDASDHYVLLAGDTETNPSVMVTWEFTAGGWSQVTPVTSPPYAMAEGLAYDASDGYVLLLVGSAGAMQTWSYHAGLWTNRTSTAGTPPPTGSPNPLVYDSTDGYALMIGSWYYPPGPYTAIPAGGTWSFHGGTWHNLSGTAGAHPPAEYEASVADDPADGGVLFWGGTAWVQGLGNNDTWLFASGNWTLLPRLVHPIPRNDMRGAYDPLLKQDVFFGGVAWGSGNQPACPYEYGTCGDTWVWSNHTSRYPVVTSFTVSAAAVDVGETTRFSVGAGGGTGPLSYSYLGLPSGCVTLNLSTLACVPTVSGHFQVEVVVTDASGVSSSATVNLLVFPDPIVTAFVASPSSLTIGTTTDLSTTPWGGTGTYAYNYSGLPPGCTTQSVPVLPCVPATAGAYNVSVSLVDSSGWVARANLTLLVLPAGLSGNPTVSSFLASPSALVLGNATNLSVVASASSPLTYAYVGLPSGCSTSNVSRLNCRPTSAGSFSITVTVQAAGGGSTRVPTNLTVYPAGSAFGPQIFAFTASPPLLEVNQSTQLDVVVSGGTPPLHFLYSGLPVGCSTVDSPLLDCAPERAGNYSVEVLVTDAVGGDAQLVTDLSVLVGPGYGAIPLELTAFYADPSTVPVGSPTTFHAVVTGGISPFHYAYAGLPSSCTANDTDSLVCTPSTSATYSVRLTVTDASGHNVTALTALRVTSSPSPSPGSLAGLGPFSSGDVALAGIAGAIVGLAAGWALLRRHPPPRVHRPETAQK